MRSPQFLLACLLTSLTLLSGLSAYGQISPDQTVQTVIPEATNQSTGIIEPQAIYQLADGRLVMNRDCQN
jgi:hypothetical protein